MGRQQALVRKFHRATGATIGETPGIRDGDLRTALILEEAFEFQDAIEDGDLIGAIDALCDILYVTFGAAVTFGINLDPFFDEVQRSNMTKVGGEVRADGKRLKPPTYSPPDLHRVFAETYPEHEVPLTNTQIKVGDYP